MKSHIPSPFTLIIILLVAINVGQKLLHEVEAAHYTEPEPMIETVEPKEVRIVVIKEASTTEEVAEYETRKEDDFLAFLSMCESSDNPNAVGDNGQSIGWYQWQYESLMEVMGRYITYGEYIEIAMSYSKSTYWTRYAYFELGQDWRWVNCTNKYYG